VGLYTKLITQNSDLRLLKFGKDLPGGGTSKQPYVTKPLPGVTQPLSPNSPDFLLRQGTLRRIVDDETRFFKYFTSIPGLAFIGKQNLLSLTSVRTQASRGPSNQGVYLPTSTAAQLAANPFGGHLNFLGVDPTGLLGGITKYGDLVNPPLGIGSISKPDGNRLIALQNSLKDKTATSNFNFVKGTTINPLPGVLYNYRGGPGAVEGKGKTNIKRYSFTGLDNPLYTSDKNYFLGKNNNKIHIPDDPSTWVNIPLGATDFYNGTGLADLGKSGIVTPSSFLGSTFTLGNINTSVYKTNYSSGTGSLLDKREDLNTYLVGKQHTPDDPSTWVNIPLGATDFYNGTGLADLGQSGIVTPSSFLGSTFTLGNINTSVYKTNYSSGTGSLLDKREDLNTYLVGKQHTPDDPSTFKNNPLAKTDIKLYNNQSLYAKGDKDILSTSNTEVWNSKTIADESLPTNTGEIREDFRKKLRNAKSTLPLSILSYSGNKALDKRLNQGTPGARGNITNYTAGKKDGSENSPYKYGLDEINALPLYQSSTGEAKTTKDGPVNDLIKFRIASVNNNDPNKAVYTHFRAFIDSFSDSYGTNWSGERYPGRGEEFFKYGGFTRGISLSFTVAAQSKEELIPMYKKLNFLASNTMNDYSNSGYMRAPFIRLTIGGYLYEQFGFLKGINYGWEMAAPFEIGINTEGEYDSNVKELPHVIRVTGFEFQPIYDFLPQKQTNIYAGQSTQADGDVTQFGKERYIALSTGLGPESSNYGSEFVPQTLDSVFTPTPIPPLNVPESNIGAGLTKPPSLDMNLDTELNVDIPNFAPLPGMLYMPNFVELRSGLLK
jgi:hypothetical protein